ncbi:SpoIIE family protein phosphatase [Collinsella sp. zg1085]|uniref:GAF domain-containing SpoIIE family protein phosphatase n=1 Tax=Collinsella sp. zg1085 TaxID=2844380 RepID=UPI001C0E3B93|nr:SpoIIE family protein phosphatase [Collinsella sp. zg1085]QWT18066.1 SpoIIE family protein phosphatase [Collinsella sp. zg1085]
MEAMSERELAEVAHIVEITSDAVILCALDGTVLHVNQQTVQVLQSSRERIVGHDVKDLLFSANFERASEHALPFSIDGADNTQMLKLSDGSFIPVRVRALPLTPARFALGERRHKRILVVLKSLETELAHDRKTKRLLARLSSANKRLSGTLDIIMATAGSKDVTELIDTVLNRLVDTLDADGATIYFAEAGGFKLRGTSQQLIEKVGYVPSYVPLGAGVGTYVLHAGSACRFSVIAPVSKSAHAGMLYDLDKRVSKPLQMQDTPPFKALIAVPVFFGTQVLGVIELGWLRPTTPRKHDVHVLEIICDYLSIELVELVSNLRAQRTAELTRSMNHVRDALFQAKSDARHAWQVLMTEIRHMLSCHVCTVIPDSVHNQYYVDFDGGSRRVLPGSIEDLFFSTTLPVASPARTIASGGFMPYEADADVAPRVVRVEMSSSLGMWLQRHGLPCQGVFVDFGQELTLALTAQEEVSTTTSSPVTALDRAGRIRRSRMVLFLRDATQEPIDDVEYDYLERMTREFKRIDIGERERKHEQLISQALQLGMQSRLAHVPGLITDALYSSATKQALVGGDFYTLVRLPDKRAVMILGDVSGKGIEAASMSAMVKTALTAYAWEGMQPVAMVRALNRMLTAFSRVETFVTVFVAKIDIATGVLRYCSAGNPPTMLARANGEAEFLTVQSGVVGAFDTMQYKEGFIELEAGDILFMYTDGAIEARNPDGDFYGEERLQETIRGLSALGVSGLCHQVLDNLDRFTGSGLDDDVAMVALSLNDEA